MDISAQSGRNIQSLNYSWSFHKGEIADTAEWTTVNLPHTWNAFDPFDEEKGYYRGVSYYKRSLKLPLAENKNWFLYFEGVNQVAEVYVNGQLATKHIGGYTGFSVPLTQFLQEGENQLLVKVDNSHNEAIAPLKGDFNFYGGIYRDVFLISTGKTHFEFSEYGDKGIFISTPKVSEKEALVTARLNISSSDKSSLKIITELIDPEGISIFKKTKKTSLKSGTNTLSYDLPKVNNPKLWHPDHPYLYQLKISLESAKGQKLDEQMVPFGFRWFRFDANDGFYLNGKYLKLIGTNRHQDFEGLGNALSDQRHLNDVQLIKEMGSNFFRTAHYPQDPAVIRAANKLGLLVSMEIPLDHDITDSEAFYENSQHMMKEMIRQNYNHPSIIIWAYMNEMLLGRNLEKDQEIIKKIVDFAKVLEDLTRKEDSSRYTMIPNHGSLELYQKAGLTQIPMLVGWNLYFGWYEAQLGAGKFLDAYHQLVPAKPMVITEYGAGSDPRIRSFNPVRFDFSIEWQTKFHQQNLIDIMERPFVSGAAVWNLADFGSENRNDAVPKINSKGLISVDRTPKDAYHLYQAWLLKKPFVKIGGENWQSRVGYSDKQNLQVFTNADHIELLVNGQAADLLSFENHLSEWRVSLKTGRNILKATAYFGDSSITDYSEINFGKINKDWLSNNTLYFNCGANFFFTDPIDHITWLPETEFNNELLGYKGGEVFMPRGQGVGTDREIFLTNNDPIYQTARIGGEYYFDLEAGQYEVVLHWAEIDPAYQDKNRQFDILFNDKVVVEGLQSKAAFTAISKKIITYVDKEGLKISFKLKEGEPILNAIEIRKL
ncbi:beta-galactosidase [Marivirga lumbricoides]|uniref:Beta-galactosidase n=1 Tax=Marivirga lumbricoides TaxID=1046115 RepID=A0ABQ1MHK0_9BACT|nr:beta-galactosidase [Marivirga lumbricoides]